MKKCNSLADAKKMATVLATDTKTTHYIGKRGKDFWVTTMLPASFKWVKEKLEFCAFVKP